MDRAQVGQRERGHQAFAAAQHEIDTIPRPWICCPRSAPPTAGRRSIWSRTATGQPALSAADGVPPLYLAKDGHWTARGHAVAAEGTAGFVAERLRGR